jgi:hypothetical protein
MRTIGMALVLVTLGAGARADEMYRWRDVRGQTHFTNVPTAGSEALGLGGELAPAAAPAPAAGGEATEGDAPPAEAADDGFASDASLRRQALEREHRDTQRRLQAVDAELAQLAQARTRNAAGSAATGGVRADAAAVRTDEERSLGEQRDKIAAEADKIRQDYARLRDEVSGRLGGVPAWWIELR